jgi:hypothetical protein
MTGGFSEAKRKNLSSRGTWYSVAFTPKKGELCLPFFAN